MQFHAVNSFCLVKKEKWVVKTYLFCFQKPDFRYKLQNSLFQTDWNKKTHFKVQEKKEPFYQLEHS